MSMLLCPTPERLTGRARLPMAFVSLFAIHGRVSISFVPLTISVGQSTLLALARELNGPADVFNANYTVTWIGKLLPNVYGPAKGHAVPIEEYNPALPARRRPDNQANPTVKGKHKRAILNIERHEQSGSKDL